MNLSHFIRYWSRFRADQPALAIGDDHLDWSALEDRVARLAAGFQGLGLQPGDRVACYMTNSIEWCVGYAATLRAGGIFVPMNPGLGRAELQAIEVDVGCRFIISRPDQIAGIDGRSWPEGPADACCIYDRTSGAERAIFMADALAAPVAPAAEDVASDDDSVAVICYTSGTTGKPKGVMLTHRGIHACIMAQVLAWGWGDRERFLLLAPLSFTGGVVSLLTTALVIGARIRIEPAFDPERALRLLGDDAITYMGGVPIFWQRLAALPAFVDADLSHLRSATTAGAPVAETLMSAYSSKGVYLRQAYGCTEASGMIATPNLTTAMTKPWTCGPASLALDLKIMSSEGSPCPVGTPGEIWIRGPQVMKGYWNDPAASRDVLADGWLRTGDLGMLDADGDLQIVGRSKTMIISGGVNIYPAEIENMLATVEGIDEVAVFGVPDAQWGERVVALIHGPARPDLGAIHQMCREALGGYKTPKEIVFSEIALTRTASNKISRPHLHDQYLAACSIGEEA